MPGIEDEGDMVDASTRRVDIRDALVIVEVLQRHHVDRADETTVMIVGEERPYRQCLRIDIQGTEARQEARQRYQRAHLLVGRGWRLVLHTRRRGEHWTGKHQGGCESCQQTVGHGDSPVELPGKLLAATDEDIDSAQCAAAMAISQPGAGGSRLDGRTLDGSRSRRARGTE